MGAAKLPNHISARRLLLLTVLSNGIYLYYWFWVTWRQYRNHTGERVFPGWHTLALGVPIYGLFHVHEHMTAYNRLMPGSGTTGINAMLSVALMLVSMVLSICAAALSISSAFQAVLILETGPSAVQSTLMKFAFDGLNIILAAGLLTYAQRRINACWENLPQVQVSSARLGWGEFVCVIIGGLDITTGSMTLVGIA